MAGADGPRVILVGVDGSATSLRAGAYAAGLARRQGARLVIVHVSSLPAAAYLAPVAAAAALDTAGRLADEIRDEVMGSADRLGVPVEFRTERGEPVGVLSRVAAEMLADMVVVGASARFGHRIAGSVAVRLVKAGRWPVVVVP